MFGERPSDVQLGILDRIPVGDALNVLATCKSLYHGVRLWSALLCRYGIYGSNAPKEELCRILRSGLSMPLLVSSTYSREYHCSLLKVRYVPGVALGVYIDERVRFVPVWISTLTNS